MAKYDVKLTDSFVVYDDELELMVEELLEESNHDGEGPTIDRQDAWGDAFAELIREELESRFRDGYPLTFAARKLDTKDDEPVIHVTTGE
tara:strand:- start:416 stop:685 length:270 start_codon:yes stop_codon:yes gene_type:complete